MIHIRDATKDDLAFITSSWMQSYYPQCNMSFEDYKHFQNKLVKKILSRSYNLVACDDTDHDLIFGWVSYDEYLNDPVIHYLYVKALYRRMGISKQLMAEIMGNNKDYYYYTHKPEKKKILECLTFASGEYCEHLRYGEFYEQE